MKELTQQQRSRLRVSWLVAVAPVTLAVVKVLADRAPLTTLWTGIGMSVVAFLLFRFLAGFSPFGHPLHFGRSRAFRVWQSPVLWLPVVIVAALLLFFWRGP